MSQIWISYKKADFLVCPISIYDVSLWEGYLQFFNIPAQLNVCI